MQLDGTIAPGLDVVELFGLDTDVLDVEITANRPDSMSVVGLARELAASYGIARRWLPSAGQSRARARSEPPVRRRASRSNRPTATASSRNDSTGSRVAPAPAWMRVRLALAGQRPINNLVDVSNYVMLETGQPLHFYDAAMLPIRGSSCASAREGERIVTLDGVERTLSPQALVIADDERALGLAGLMGGAASEVTRDDDRDRAGGRELQRPARPAHERARSDCAPRLRRATRSRWRPR